ncbi:MAG TPA: hypothetical protein VFW33_07680 [Gemmataceae bacterium]|nr:hypothetical protein [Gemmataceae bacterium]
MRVASALCAIALALAGGGCSLVAQGTSTAVYRTRSWLDDCAERRRDRHWAEAAWKVVRRDGPAANYSADYAEGFKDGFVQYLYEGGTGEPPALPPRSYRALAYQTPQGYQAIEDWFAGYRHGAAVAEQHGYRNWVTGPSSLRAPDGPGAPALPVAAPLPAAAPPAGEARLGTARVVRARQPILPPPAPPPIGEESEPNPAARPAPAWSRINEEPPPRPMARVVVGAPIPVDDPPRAPSPPILWRKADQP